MNNTEEIYKEEAYFTNRRKFLKISGLTIVGTGLLLAGCNDNEGNKSSDQKLPGVTNGVFDLGGGDFGVLTYAYALEQLEADFYTRVVGASGFATIFTAVEQQLITDLCQHEVIHREFFKTVLTAALPNPSIQLLPNLAFTYGTLNFSNRTQVLATAKALEDTGVAAYNGAGRLISNPDYLLLAGKIVSVEARHASAIRSLINPNSKDFAGDDVVNTTTGFDVMKTPSEVLAIAKGFITTEFSALYLP